MKTWFSEYKRSILISTLATLLPTVMGCILWNRLPALMTTHWDTSGTADGSSGKVFVVFVLPVILAALNLLGCLITALDRKQNKQNKKAMGIVFWMMPLISTTSCCFIYAISMGKSIEATLLLPALMGVLFIVIGNYMPKIKQNASLGIKIYWTLHNEENWNKTHRLAGKVWVVGGFAMLLTALLPTNWIFPALLSTILLMCLIPTIYSYSIYKNHKAQGISYVSESKEQKQNKRIVLIPILLVLAITSVLMFTGNIDYSCGADALDVDTTYGNKLTISYAQMDTVELRENFDAGHRVFGFGSARLSIGTFQNTELGNYTLYAYNACDDVILIRSGEAYLAINDATAEQTQGLYKLLLEKVGN